MTGRRKPDRRHARPRRTADALKTKLAARAAVPEQVETVGDMLKREGRDHPNCRCVTELHSIPPAPEHRPLMRVFTSVDRMSGRPDTFQSVHPAVRVEFLVAGSRAPIGVRMTADGIEISTSDMQLIVESVAGNTVRILTKEF